MKALRRIFLSALFVAGCATLWTPVDSRAENWAHWRGPFFNGSTTETNLPVAWSTNENIAWTASLSGISGSTPIIWGDRIFITCPDASKNLTLLCLNRADGKTLWQKTVAEGDRSKGRNDMASPSPVTDGTNVFVIFGTGELAAYDFAGNQLWLRNLAKEYGRFSLMWLYGSSPLLFQNKLYIQVLQRNQPPPDYSASTDGKTNHESYLLCVDPKTGTNIWRQIRPTQAREEAQEAYSSPIPDTHIKGMPEIIVVGGNVTTAHDPATGRELWRFGGLNPRDKPDWRIVPSPLVSGMVVVVCAPKREPVFGIFNPPDAGEQSLAWSFNDFPSDCTTPLAYENQIFALDGDKQMMTCLNPTTGAVKWQGNLGVREIFRGSPTGADGKIYCITENGTVVVLSAGDEFKILATIPMGGERVYSSIAPVGGQLFIRAGKNLFCVGRGK